LVFQEGVLCANIRRQLESVIGRVLNFSSTSIAKPKFLDQLFINTLWKIDALLFPMRSGIVPKPPLGERPAMVEIMVVTVLCMLGIGFYIRFLIALVLDPRNRRVCYSVRLEPGTSEYGTGKIKVPRESCFDELRSFSANQRRFQWEKTLRLR
jgi:hypothetical protein